MVRLLHGLIMLDDVIGVAFFASMPVAPMELINGVRLPIIAISYEWAFQIIILHMLPAFASMYVYIRVMP